MTESVTVKVIPKEKASKTYIKVGDGNYQEYTGEISVSKNVLIRAYYIREEDGKTSETSYYYIQNIKKASKPYVRIDATPDYLSEKLDKVTVKISGSNYTKLEYSLDGVIYEEYKGELTVEESQTIYAKGTNEFGETIESLDITTRTSPKEKENIEISIEVSPRKEEVEGLINKAKVKITYEKKATKRYYKLGYYGEWKEYTGEFEITDNKTIYAYATGDNAVGNARKSVNYLTTGIASPIISIEPYGKSQQVKVSIEYASTAEITRYKIGNGEYRDYNGPFYVYENETIYAYNKDELGNTGTSEYRIKNIVSAPNYVSIDKGKYYIIKLHYPETSSNREYKWKSDGVWNSYNGYGILLIKPEYKEEFKDIKDGIKVEDEYGKEIIFTDHYYFIDVPFSELMENLFMRWDTEKISAPKIIEIPEEVTREASISIVYNKALVKKLYKIVYEDGEETEWLTYEKPFKIDKNKATIYAKGITRSESESKVGSKTITNIDDTDPEIRVKGNFEKAARQINVTVNAIDEFGIDKVKFVKGEQTKGYFKKNGNGIKNGSSFKVEENGKYTIYAVDYVGNEVIKVIEITNIDKEAPNIRINILTESYGTEAEIEIEYGDSVKKEYKIGKNGSYKEYTGTIKITSNEVLDLVNEDGSLTVYGRGTDEAGNGSEVSEDVYILDLDAPATPEITAGAGYPILTEYGVKLGSKSYIKYDNRDDITNYYSIDNGATWKVYTGPFEITSGTIKAKSVKKESGLTIEATKKVDMPSDALGSEAYDGDENTYVEAINATANKYINVSKELWNQKIYVKMSGALAGNITLNADLIFIKEDGTEISKIQSGRGALSGEYQIPTGTSKIKIQLSYFSDQYGKARIYEISPSTTPTIIQTNTYPQLSSTSFDKAKYQITINYLSYFQQKLYSLDNGTTWLDYKGIINVKAGDVIQAKAIDKDGKETEVSTYTVKGLTDNLDDKAFDKDKNTSVTLSSKQTKSFILDGVDNEVLRIYTTGKVDTRAYIKLYDKENKELSTVTLNADLTTLVIPEGSVKASIYSGTSTLTINEVNLREVKASKENYPEITINDTNWTTTKAVEILYPEGTEREYSLDLGTTWNKYTNELTIDKETTIFARSIKEGKIISTNSFIITKVDSVEPIIELDIPEKIIEAKEYEIPTSVKFGSSGGNVSCKSGENEITTTKNLEIGEYKIICVATSNSGKVNTITKKINVIGKVDLSFESINGEQTFIAPISGTYKLEVWGASGGTLSQSYRGGYGAYSTGDIHIDENQVLYINIGGVGEVTSSAIDQIAQGGYNGGGSGANYSLQAGRVAGGGGGATHIAFVSGKLASLEKYKGSLSDDGKYYVSNDIVIVSGGGGGSWYFPTDVNYHTVTPGDAGGIQASNSVAWTEQAYGYVYASGGTQIGTGTQYATVKGGFGEGASRTNYITAGGGGGFFGGNAGDLVGAGGSSYIANPLLTNKSMYCYNCQESSEESTKTISTTCVNETPTEDCAKIGNGYARITYIGE